MYGPRLRHPLPRRGPRHRCLTLSCVPRRARSSSGPLQLILDSQNREGGLALPPAQQRRRHLGDHLPDHACGRPRNAASRPKNKVDRCVEYVKLCQDRRDGWFPLHEAGGRARAAGRSPAPPPASPPSTAPASTKGPEVEAGLKYLLTCKPTGGFVRPDMQYFYGHYYAVQAMWTAAATTGPSGYPAIRDELVSRQRVDGSWQDRSASLTPPPWPASSADPEQLPADLAEVELLRCGEVRCSWNRRPGL